LCLYGATSRACTNERARAEKSARHTQGTGVGERGALAKYADRDIREEGEAILEDRMKNLLEDYFGGK
jgi:hypothetical protein